MHPPTASISLTHPPACPQLQQPTERFGAGAAAGSPSSQTLNPTQQSSWWGGYAWEVIHVGDKPPWEIKKKAAGLQQ